MIGWLVVLHILCSTKTSLFHEDLRAGAIVKYSNCFQFRHGRKLPLRVE